MSENNENKLNPLELVRNVALSVTDDAAQALLRRAITQHPNRTPAEVLGALDKMYLTGTITSGAAVGAVAAAPGVGTLTALAANVTEVTANLTATMTLALAYAHIHGLEIVDVERKTTLLMGVLLGDTTKGLIAQVSERTGTHWAKQFVKAVPASSLKEVNKILGKNFVTKFGTKEGIIVLGREAPFFIGAFIGGVANGLMAKFAIKSMHKAFGPPPANFPTRTN